jgi:hypothetical protein
MLFASLCFPCLLRRQNVLAFTPPGFSQTLWVKFPDSRLAVCERCKKNFKTREMCRVRNRHSMPPWTTAYICVSVDDSCLDVNGKFVVDEEFTVRMVQWQPYCVTKPFEAKAPVCASCKKTNRTRSFCRERHRHRFLPWNTVYVLLSTLKSVDPSTVVAAKPEDSTTTTSSSSTESTTNSSSFASGTKSDTESLSSPESVASKSSEAEQTTATIIGGFTDTDTIASSDNDQNGDDINDVPDSRTFLAVVSSRGTSIHWLELGTVLDTADAAPSPPPLATAIMNNGYQAYSQFAVPTTFDLAQNHSFFNAATAAAAAAAATTMNNYAAQQQQHGLQQRQQLFFQQQLMAAPATAVPPLPLFPPTWQLPTPFCFSPADVTATSGDAALTAAQVQHLQHLQQQQQQLQLQPFEPGNERENLHLDGTMTAMQQQLLPAAQYSYLPITTTPAGMIPSITMAASPPPPVTTTPIVLQQQQQHQQQPYPLFYSGGPENVPANNGQYHTNYQTATMAFTSESEEIEPNSKRRRS